MQFNVCNLIKVLLIQRGKDNYKEVVKDRKRLNRDRISHTATAKLVYDCLQPMFFLCFLENRSELPQSQDNRRRRFKESTRFHQLPFQFWETT